MTLAEEVSPTVHLLSVGFCPPAIATPIPAFSCIYINSTYSYIVGS
jgi:hypothetical protein